MIRILTFFALASFAQAMSISYSGVITGVTNAPQAHVGDTFMATLTVLDSFTPSDSNPDSSMGEFIIPTWTGKTPFLVTLTFRVNTYDLSFIPFFIQPIQFTDSQHGDSIQIFGEAGPYVAEMLFTDSTGAALTSDVFSQTVFEPTCWENIEFIYNKSFVGPAFTGIVTVPEPGPGLLVTGAFLAMAFMARLRPKRSQH